MKKWDLIALAIERTYCVHVDWDERFFECPECGEPIYECDWDAEEDWMGDGLIACPVCNFMWEI